MPRCEQLPVFVGSVESLFRGARVAGPKVVRLEWPSDDLVRVVMDGFPMDQMPEVMRISFLGKMESGLRETEEKFSIQNPVRVEIVDQTTGKVMAQIDG